MARPKKLSETTTETLRLLGEALSQESPNDIKSFVATAIERILHDHNRYGGYNNLYWLKYGYKKWLEDGQPDFPQKNSYITGEGMDSPEPGIVGEFSRHYYIKD